MTTRIVLSGDASAVLRRVRVKYGEELVFMIGGGCCDNTSPMLLRSFRAGARDVHLGDAEGVPMFAEPEQARFLRGKRLVVDVGRGRGNSFSLELSQGVCFILRSTRSAGRAVEGEAE